MNVLSSHMCEEDITRHISVSVLEGLTNYVLNYRFYKTFPLVPTFLSIKSDGPEIILPGDIYYFVEYVYFGVPRPVAKT
jgi:hypothetical protein